MTSEENIHEIPVEGSLGLLALGAVGIRAWRKKQKEVGYKNPNENMFAENSEALDKNE